ncbi:MAG: TetR/AcrR family transcriptional regulator [Deltaproteobacteria bacterium]|jgi:AcrR family transcriptional regulator|nr:TetR/AcrR family transcriptional regulator [Deltaproteobacteria bacterium]
MDDAPRESCYGSAVSEAARHRLQVDERRKQLIDLALELFGNRPYDEISIDEIAKEAGVSKGLLYHYFPSKRAFFVAAVEAAAERLIESTDVPTAGDVPTMAEMREGVGRYLDYVDRHARNYLLLVRGGDGVDEEVQAIVDRTRMAFLERVRDAAALLPKGPEVDITLRGYIGYVETVSLEWVEHKGLSRDALADLIVRQCIALFSTVQR